MSLGHVDELKDKDLLRAAFEVTGWERVHVRPSQQCCGWAWVSPQGMVVYDDSRHEWTVPDPLKDWNALRGFVQWAQDPPREWALVVHHAKGATAVTIRNSDNTTLAGCNSAMGMERAILFAVTQAGLDWHHREASRKEGKPRHG